MSRFLVSLVSSRLASLAVVLGGLAACSVPPTSFTGDDGGGGPGPPSLVLAPASVVVGEGATSMFTVALSAEPATRVHVTLASADDNRLGVTPASLDLDPASWAVAHAVTVTGKSDTDTEDELVAVTVDADAVYIDDASVMVTIDDDDDLGIVATPSLGLQVDESQTAPLMVRLNAPPTGDVDVTVASSDMSIITASPASLRFTVANWELDQTVVVSAVVDTDTDHEDANVMLSALGLDTVPVAVTAIDRDVQNIVPSVAHLGTRAEGTTTSFTVTLRFPPTAPITVGVATTDAQVAMVSPASLSFDAGNWNMPHTVTVTLPEDVDTADESAEIDLTGPAPLVVRHVGVAVTDDDEQVIVATPSPITLLEGGVRGLDVKLAFQPDSDVSLSVLSVDPAVATAVPGTLTFTPSNYGQAQPVTVTAAQDLDPDDDTTFVRLTSTTDPLSRDVVVNVTDDDQLLIATSTSNVSLVESGSAVFNVHLTAMPAATVTVNLSSGDPSAATVTPTLTFTPANFAADQPVTVTGVDDLDLATDTVTINLAATGVAGVPPATVSATVSDQDVQEVIVSPASISVNEAGSGTLNVSLRYTPSADTTVAIAAADTGVAMVGTASLTFTPANHATPKPVTVSGVNDADAVDETTTVTATAGAAMGSATVTVNDDDPLGIATSATTLTVGEAGSQTLNVRLTAQPAAGVSVMIATSDGGAASISTTMLGFTPSNWNTNQPVLVSGVGDTDPLDESVTLTLTATGLTTRTVAVTVTDDDPQGIVTSVGTVTLTENGSASFNVHLAAMPASDVTVNVASASISAATVSTPSLTFTPANYLTDQGVTVNGVDDTDLATDSVAINLTSSGLPTRTVSASVTNLDVQTVQVTPTGSITVNEGGTASVSFRLAFTPAANTTVTLTSGHAGLGVAPGSLSFTPANHATFQPVTLSGIADVDAADVMTTLTAAPPSGNSAVVNVTVDDPDQVLILTTLPSVTLTEPGSGTVGVKLAAQPQASVTVNVSSSDMGAATATPATRTFTTSNWNTNQDITIAAVSDADVANEGVTVTLASTGLPSVNVGVTITDDDVVGIAPSVTSLIIDEPSTGMFNVALDHQPPAGVTVNISSSDALAAMVSPASLSFTTSNWATGQPVTVTGVADADADAESVAISLSSPSVTVPRTVTVTVRDDELVLSDLSVQMGSAAGGTSVTATGAGFTTGTIVALAGRALQSVVVPSPTQLTGTTQSGSRFVDAVVTKGAVTATIPRAFYHGTWEQASGGLWGGTVDVLLAAGPSTVLASSGGVVYRSTDSGATWSVTGTANPYMNGWGLAVDPQNSQRLYATGSGNGVYISTNGGATWTGSNLNRSVGCIGVAPSNSGMLYTCEYTQLWRSLDSGLTWSSSLTVTDPRSVAFSAQDSNIAYVAAQTGVYKTTNGGVSWTQVNGNSANLVAVDPTNASIAYAVTPQAGTLRTTNGGTTWSPAYTGLSGGPNAFAVHPTTPSTLYAGVWDGVYRSTDSGASWSPWAGGMGSGKSDVRSLALRPGNPNELYAGVGAWGLYRSTNGGASWAESDTGIAGYSTTIIAPHPTVAGTVFAAPQGMGLWKSVDSGTTWTSVQNGLPQTPGYHTPIALAYVPGTPTTMFAGTGGGVYRSTDGGASWNPMSSGIPSSTAVYGFAIAPATPATVIAGTIAGVYRSTDSGASWNVSNGGLGSTYVTSIAFSGGAYYVVASNAVYRSTDAGASWSLASTGLPGFLGQAPLVVDALSGAVYLQASSTTYRTTDGTTWSSVATSTTAVAVDPTRSATVYVAGSGPSVSMRRSLTSLSSLVGFSDGLPAVYGGQLAVDRTGGTVYLSVWSRGLWRVGQ